MTNSLITELRQELSQLERKTALIRSLLTEYSAEDSPIIAPIRQYKKSLIKSELEQILHAGAMHRKGILQILISRGLMGHEKNPLQSLAIYLSNDFREYFMSAGDGVWKLRDGDCNNS